MPNQSVVTLRPFIKGLNTELNGTIDSTENTADELNCTIYNDGTRGRRYGMSLERYGEYFKTNMAQAYSGYLWKNVNKTPVDFIVYQTDNILHFYRYTQKPYSVNKLAATLDLSAVIVDPANFLNSAVSYTIADGRLIVVNKYMSPIIIKFDDSSKTFSYEKITIYYRDFEGLEDGLRIDEMPTTLSNEHKYNLINQGWQENEIKKSLKTIRNTLLTTCNGFLVKMNQVIFKLVHLLPSILVTLKPLKAIVYLTTLKETDQLHQVFTVMKANVQSLIHTLIDTLQEAGLGVTKQR